MRTWILLSFFLFYCCIGYSQKTKVASGSKNKKVLILNLSTSLRSYETLCKVMIAQDTVTLKKITTKGGYVVITRDYNALKRQGEYYLQNLYEKSVAVEYETTRFSRIGIYYKNGHEMMKFVNNDSDEWKFDGFLRTE